MKTRTLRSLAAAALLASAGTARATSYYVAPSGNDSGAGTMASPFLTLSRGVSAAGAGDTIIVRDGTYLSGSSGMGVTINKAGTSSAPITLKAERKGGAILKCQPNAHSFISFGGSSAYWVIQGFDITGCYSAGIFANSRGAKNVVIRGNHFHHIGNHPDETSIGIMGIYTDNGATNMWIDGNVFNDIGRTTHLTGNHDHGIYIKGVNTLITNNVFYNVLNGWHIQTAAGFSGTIAHNTFYGPNPHPQKYGQMVLWGSNSNLVIRNNIFYAPRSFAIWISEFSLSGSCTFDNNIIYTPGASVGLSSSLPGGCVQTGNRLNVDPQMVNPVLPVQPNYDLHLKAGSPAVNTAAAMPSVPLDFDGVTRPQGAGYDVGAFEYSGTTPLPSADTAAPVISGVAAGAISQSGATISWTTSEAADTQVEYGPTAAYGASTPLNALLSASHSAALSGLSAGSLYHYRVKSKDAAGNLATSADAVFTTLAAAPAAGCLTSAGSWQNAALTPQTGTFTAEFDAVPGQANIDGVSGLSDGPAADYAKLAAAVRFNNAGAIDARNGGAYAAAAVIPYVGGLTYHFRLVVDLPARKYSAYVRQGANAEQSIGAGYAFRTEQAAVATLNSLGLFSSTGSEQVCAVKIVSSDATAPVISAVTASAVGQNGATIGWTTNEASDTQVEYGPTTAYGASSVPSAVLSTSHSAALSGLSPGTLYHYRVKSKDAAGNLTTSGDFTFTTAATADTAAPVISAVAAGSVSQSGATIGWTTSEPADTQVEYGPTTAYGASTVLNSSLSASHSAALSGLSPGTLYHYRVKSKDAAGNLAVSPDASFTTSAAAPAAGCVASAGSWQNVALAAQTGTFAAEFDAVPSAGSIDGVAGLSNGPAAGYDKLAAAVRFNTAGTIDARNGGAYAAAAVIPYVGGLTYHFRLVVNIPAHTYSAYVRQGANAEQLIGGGYAFRTEQAAVSTLSHLGLLASTGSEQVCAVKAVSADGTAPLISAAAASAISQTGATIGWTTNEASDTQVEYGPTTAYGASTPLNAAPTLNHSAVLSGLSPGTLYHYRVKSKDAAGNLATSPDATFTTASAVPACVTSAGAWQNVPLTAQTGAFTLEFDATPSQGGIDGVAGLSDGPASGYEKLAAAVRFNTGGTIDARNGPAYASGSRIPYAAGLTYHFRLAVNLPAHTYSAYVRQGAGAEQLIGGGYAFRKEQAAVAVLNNLGLFASRGSEQVCGAAVR